MKNAFNRLIIRLNTTEETICELEGMSIDTSQTYMAREKGMKKPEKNIQELRDNNKRCNT